MQALYDAMYSEASSSATVEQSSPNQLPLSDQGSQATDAQNASNVPWATLMGQVGLAATGNLATDYNTFSEKISAMQVSATSQQDKASIDQLEAEASIVFVQQDQPVTQGSSQVQDSSQSKSVTGADIKAQLNKLYFLG